MSARRLLAVIAALTALVFGCVVLWAHWPHRSLAGEPAIDVVVVKKEDRTLELVSKGSTIRTYPISLGSNPVGPKDRIGDGKTPEGNYTIDYRNAESAYHLSLHVSYPGPADLRRAEASNVRPGGLIMIHGLPNDRAYLGRLHRLRDWTDGCIAVTNAEIEELWRIVPDGTPIRIEP